MNDAKRRKDYRVIAYIFVVAALFSMFNLGALAIRIMDMPIGLKLLIDKPTKLIFIEGNPCNECPSGKYIVELMNQTGTYALVFVVPSDYTENDVSNFKRAFSVQGTFVRSDDETKKVVNKLMTFLKVKPKTGICITTSPRGKVKKVDAF